MMHHKHSVTLPNLKQITIPVLFGTSRNFWDVYGSKSFPGLSPALKFAGKNSRTFRNFLGDTVSHVIPVTGRSILDGQLPKLIVHLVVEVLAEEERPEPKQRVHLG